MDQKQIKLLQNWRSELVTIAAKLPLNDPGLKLSSRQNLEILLSYLEPGQAGTKQQLLESQWAPWLLLARARRFFQEKNCLPLVTFPGGNSILLTSYLGKPAGVKQDCRGDLSVYWGDRQAKLIVFLAIKPSCMVAGGRSLAQFFSTTT